MGLRTVAIYTEADRHSPYVGDADLSVKIESLISTQMRLFQQQVRC